MLNHYFPVDIEDEMVLVFKMSKGNYDEYERKYGNVDRSMKAARLIQKNHELTGMLEKSFIDFATFDMKQTEIEEELKKLGKIAEELKIFKLEDGSEYTTSIATYSIAEKLSITVFLPILDGEGKQKKDESGMPEKTPTTIEYWITEVEETIFNKLSDVVDHLQLFGAGEPVTIFDDIIQLFVDDVEQADGDIAIPVSEIMERLSSLRTSYVTGEIYRKKSESAYGVRIHGMR